MFKIYITHNLNHVTLQERLRQDINTATHSTIFNRNIDVHNAKFLSGRGTGRNDAMDAGTSEEKL